MALASAERCGVRLPATTAQAVLEPHLQVAGERLHDTGTRKAADRDARRGTRTGQRSSRPVLGAVEWAEHQLGFGKTPARQVRPGRVLFRNGVEEDGGMFVRLCALLHWAG